MTAVELQMEPGPTLVDDRVVQALAAPPMYHQSSEFAEVVDGTCELLQQVYGTSQEVVVLPASGRGAVEAALASVDHVGRPFIVPTNGTFGRMMASVGRSIGMKVVELAHGSGELLTPAGVEAEIERHDKPVLGVVHNETSTGMLNSLSGYADLVHRRGGLFVVDAVSSLGGTAVEFDGLDIDLCASASQKSVGAPPGVSFVAVGSRARAEIEAHERPPGAHYLNLERWWSQWLPRERGGSLDSGYRRLPWTMPTNLMVALRRALELTTEEGVEERWERHRRSGAALRAAMATLEVPPVAPSGAESDTVGAFRLPGVDVSALRRALVERHGVHIAGGMDADAATVIRVAHMAESARPGPLLHTVAAITHELDRLGVSAATDPTQAFLKVWCAD